MLAFGCALAVSRTHAPVPLAQSSMIAGSPTAAGQPGPSMLERILWRDSSLPYSLGLLSAHHSMRLTRQDPT